MTKKCECFTCKYGGDKRLIKAYLIGQREILTSTLNALKAAGVTKGSISDADPLQNLFACTRYELDAVGCFLSELEDIEL